MIGYIRFYAQHFKFATYTPVKAHFLNLSGKFTVGDHKMFSGMLVRTLVFSSSFSTFLGLI
jgi:hypothetical protein